MVRRWHAVRHAIGGQIFKGHAFVFGGACAFVHGQHHQMRGQTQGGRGVGQRAGGFPAAVPAIEHAAAHSGKITT
ncbi:hypothetical protein D3C73_1575880 [compost metagenome]